MNLTYMANKNTVWLDNAEALTLILIDSVMKVFVLINLQESRSPLC